MRQTIKGKPKSVRMEEICKEAFQPIHGGSARAGLDAFMMENDGRTWDACCKSVLRSLTENRILTTMFELL